MYSFNVAIRAIFPFYAPLIDSFSYEHTQQKKNKSWECVAGRSIVAHIIFCVCVSLSKFMVPIIVWKIHKTYMYPRPVQHLRILLLLPTTSDDELHENHCAAFAVQVSPKRFTARLPNAPSSCILFQSTIALCEWQEEKKKKTNEWPMAIIFRWIEIMFGL